MRPWPPAVAPLALAVALVAAAQDDSLFERPETDRLPEGAAVVAAMRDALPGQPLHIVGELTVLDPQGEVVRTVATELELRWGDTPPQARFVIRDAFGALLARLTVVRPPGRPPVYEGAEGDPPQPVDRPDPSRPIAGTDFTWADLGLDFLWWPGGTTRRAEMKKGRLCHVVDLPVPAGRGGAAALRLWVDAHAHALLQADECDAKGDVLRRLAVTKLQKIDGEWTLKDFEVTDRRSGRKTVFRVREIRGEEAAAAPAVPPPVAGETAEAAP